MRTAAIAAGVVLASLAVSIPTTETGPETVRRSTVANPPARITREPAGDVRPGGIGLPDDSKAHFRTSDDSKAHFRTPELREALREQMLYEARVRAYKRTPAGKRSIDAAFRVARERSRALGCDHPAPSVPEE